MEQLVGSLCKRHAVAGKPAPTACKRTVSGTISLPCSGFFSPFPHGTGSLSVFGSYLALRDGPRGFRQDSSCPALLRWPLCPMNLARTRLSLSTVRLSRRFRFGHVPTVRLLQPPRCLNNAGLGSFRFARHYFGNRYFLSLPAGTKMFQFPALAHHRCVQPSTARVAPFGNLRIEACLQLPAAYRSLPRPSSPSEAKGIRRSLLFASLYLVLNKFQNLSALRCVL